MKEDSVVVILAFCWSQATIPPTCKIHACHLTIP